MSFEVFSQKTLYISPLIGVENPYCSLRKETLNAPTFKANNLYIGLSYGLIFKLKLNPKWSISTGISSGAIGWGFRFTEIESNSTNNSSFRIERRVSRAKNFHRFPLLLTYNFKEVEWIPLPKKDDSEQRYLFACDLEAILGVSYNIIGPFSRFDSSTETANDFGVGDTIPYRDSYTLKRMWGASVIAGLGMQFYRLGKPKFHLLFYYSQGLLNIANVTVEYTSNAQNYTSRLHARGTIAGIQLSYPIRLKTFKKKKSS